MHQQIVLPISIEASQPPDPFLRRLAEGRNTVGIAIFDDWDALASLKPALQAFAPNTKLFGLVSTHHTSVALDVCTATIDDWYKRHPDLDGIYIDEGPPIDANDPEQPEPDSVWDYYGGKNGLYGSLKRTHAGAQLLLNCAGCRDERIFTACDIAQIVQQDYALYTARAWWIGASRPWWTSPPIGKAIAHVVHSCPDDHDWAMRVAIGLSKRRGANYVYVCNDDPAAVASLPAYWDAELAAVADSPADPCDIIAGVLPDIAHALDDLDAEAAGATGDAKARLLQDMGRLDALLAEVRVILAECREG